MTRRVVVTGIGLISPLGITIKDFWEALIAGKSGVDYIKRFDTSEFETKIAAEVKNFDVNDYLDRKEARRMDTFTQYAVIASKFAIDDSGLKLDRENLDRIGVIIGSGIGGMDTFEREYRNYFDKGPRKISPFFIPMMIPDIAPGYISIRFGFKGPNYSTISACASSSHAIGNAFRSIQYGESDVMITGGSEATITPMGVGGFNAMKALSTRNDHPQRASRPFDADRDGFVMGEGAGILVLESEEHALRRDAKIYGEIIGVGYTADAFHITAPASDGDGAMRVMKNALKDAKISIDEVDYINAHGTSTPYNDKIESLAIKKVFGERAYRIPISSTKSMTGHLLGASGSIELIATLLTLKHDIIHPTINYETPDPDCDLNYTPNKAIHKTVNIAISNSFGFGGHNVCLVAKKYPS
ncbi:MAG: beta-ketoacyl-ACP synthase II [candidate division KSB1 bacterium]|nr:beta-ketoacyl-ACP synthase II [candidate division KSB1 bacterium]MDZ7335753.1 beta-ketoacyl-ACP synthase II [candidate division KSB1 bacterium]MDZ7357496.1 beta-ketoacyl-ACP synthase II [candidate division KSB1 bacterium]MDZ7402079.1 beta-ketoacyl-ACP synthase II [candidate division KSB1 bacterium]